MSLFDVFPTGADHTLWLGGDEIPEMRERDALEARSISIAEEDASTPLFHWSRNHSQLFARGRRAVNGVLVLNHTPRAQLPTERFWGKTIWARMQYVEYTPEGASAVRELMKIGPLYPRPFTHDPEGREAGYATDTVPFIAREVAGANRYRTSTDVRTLQEVLEDVQSSRSGLVRSEQLSEPAQVTKIVDGDTFHVTRRSHPGEDRKVRFSGIQTPETYKDNASKAKVDKDNREQQGKWQWPPTQRGPDGEERTGGAPGEFPSVEQLAAWGDRSTGHLRDLIGGQEVVLKSGPGQPDEGRYGRLIRQVESGGEDIGLRMVEDGYAIPYPTGNEATLSGGVYGYRGRKIREAYRRAQEAAGTSAAKGIWQSHEPP